MRTPRLEIYLDGNLKLCIGKVESNTELPRLIVDIDLDELKSYEPENAAHRVGGTILNILKIWHEKAFEDWEVPVVSEEVRTDDLYIAQRLIAEALEKKSAVHVSSIEVLLRQAASKSEDVREFLEDSWPVIRKRLERFGA
jgi:hypothetical protein